MQFGWTRIALASVVFAPGAVATADSPRPTASLVGTWNCATTRDHMQMRVTFRANGTVFGKTNDKQITGRYTREGEALSIVGEDQVIAATSLQIDQKNAAANLLNGDQISCRRTGEAGKENTGRADKSRRAARY